MKGSRRDLLKHGLWALAMLAGCRGGKESPSTTSADGMTPVAPDGAAEGGTPPPATSPWTIAPSPTFIQGSAATVDLAATLPASVMKGGIFAVDPSGAALPSGMTLSPAGILAVGTAAVGSATGVVFSYSV